MMTDTKVTLSAVVACLSTGNEMPFTSLPEAITFGRRMDTSKNRWLWPIFGDSILL